MPGQVPAVTCDNVKTATIGNNVLFQISGVSSTGNAYLVGVALDGFPIFATFDSNSNNVKYFFLNFYFHL